MKEKKIVAIFCLCLGFLLFAEKECRPDAEGFISDWLICGPFPSYVVNDRETGLETDCLGTEEKANPYPGLSYDVVFKADEFKMIAALDITNEWGVRYDRKVKAVWKAHKFSDPKYLCVDNWFSPIDDHFVFFGACWIESPERRTVQVRLGSDDDNKVFLNGKVIGQSATSQGTLPDQFRYNAVLNRGLNLLLIKVVDRLYGAGFCCRITSPDGKPWTDLKIYTDSPARRMRVNSYDRGFGGNFQFSATPLLDNRKSETVTFRLEAPDNAVYRVRLAGKEHSMKRGESVSFSQPLKAGTHVLNVPVLRADGSEAALLSYPYTVYSRRSLEQEIVQKTNELKKSREVLLPELRQRKEKAEQAVKKAEQALENARAAAERNYAVLRAKACSDAGASIDEPLPSAPVFRSRLLLNGIWKAGKSLNKLNSTFRLPAELPGLYWRGRMFPIVSASQNAFDPRHKALEGYEWFKVNELNFEKELSFQTDFQLDQLPEGELLFVCEYVSGHIQLKCNGKDTGSYSGFCGIVEIPLKNLRKGKNILSINWQKLKFLQQGNDLAHGLCGDIYLAWRPKVNVNDVWVKTSWRKAGIETVTELTANDGKKHTFRLEQYAVRNGRIHFRMPVSEGHLEPGRITKVKTSSKWKDPLLWSLESPNLYEMVSDLYVDGKLADRKRDTFGFREFWIHGCDFFFNGKRIILQGDVGCDEYHIGKRSDVHFPLLRKDNINMIRLDWYWPETVRLADRRGMFIYKNFFPCGDWKRNMEKFNRYGSPEEYYKSEEHRMNLANYTAWHRLYRNNPSVIIWSISNEIFTPGCESRGIDKRNKFCDDIIRFYQDYIVSLDPSLVTTRDGDVCTYDSSRDNFDVTKPANVHYPEFHMDLFVYNWQDIFEYRPAIWGETFYCSYVWGGWPGPTPVLVDQKVQMIRTKGRTYRELGIPAQIYMGVSLDGFIAFKPDGSGSPWGVIESPKKRKRIANWRNGCPPGDYPYTAVKWPADSGKGVHPEFQNHPINGFGYQGVNWSSEKYPSHVRNAVNNAYRAILIPQPELAPVTDAEVVVHTRPGADVWTLLPSGERAGVRADPNGRAWFDLPSPGRYTFESAGKKKTAPIGSKASYAEKPGFHEVPKLFLEGEE